MSRLGLHETEWSHCYQSRFGRVDWLQPYTLDKIKELAQRGVRQLIVASPSFAVDCLETLEEVAIEYRDRFLEWGGERLTPGAGIERRGCSTSQRWQNSSRAGSRDWV